jgi:TadE-like protein
MNPFAIGQAIWRGEAMIARVARGPRAPNTPRGQTMVEFALVLPILLVILLAVVDFGRVFSASMAVEASTRNAAEVGAIERLRNGPPTPGTEVAYYSALHEQVAKVVCSELSLLPNTTFVSADRTCPSMPVIRVCVHDDLDPICGYPITGFAGTIPLECGHMTVAWDHGSGGAIGSHGVEVRVCYQFTTLFNLRFTLPGNTGLDIGDIWLQRERVFALDCPPGDVSSC